MASSPSKTSSKKLREKRKREDLPKCSQLGCQFYASEDTKRCSSCGKGKSVHDPFEHMQKANRFSKLTEKLVKQWCVSDEEFSELSADNLREFLSNVARAEKDRPEMELAKIMFTAKQVKSLVENYSENSCWNIVHQKEATINLHDKILGRVLDHWNLGRKCFCPTIRCYWGSYGDFITPIALYEGREVMLSNSAGIMKPLLYCARVGDEKPSMLRMLKVGMILAKFRALS